MTKPTPRILLLSAYDAHSHRLWRTRLIDLFPEYNWTCLSLPPRHFAWKVRGNSLIWATGQAEILQHNYDLIIATSMVDLSSLRGFIPTLSKIPTILYFHENQFIFPANLGQQGNVEHLLVPLYSAFCADARIFNSEFNRHSFTTGATALLKKLPERFPPLLYDRLKDSTVVPVPLPVHIKTRVAAKTKNVLELVWNHRWEYDKGPDLLLEVSREIAKNALPIRLHIVGEKFRETPAEFAEIDQLLEQHANSLQIKRGEFSHISDQDRYEQLLVDCDVVLSTAWHDFQGLSIQEACLNNCVPLAPNALVYPEYIPAQYLYDRSPSLQTTASNIGKKLKELHTGKSNNQLFQQIDLSPFQGEKIKLRYQQVFEKLI